MLIFLKFPEGQICPKKLGFFSRFFGWRTELVFLIFDFCFKKRAPNSSPNQKSQKSKNKFCSTFRIGPKLLCFAGSNSCLHFLI